MSGSTYNVVCSGTVGMKFLSSAMLPRTLGLWQFTGACLIMQIMVHLFLARSGDDMRKCGIRTILDLRRMDRPCKKKGKKVDRIHTVARIVRKVRFG